MFHRKKLRLLAQCLHINLPKQVAPTSMPTVEGCASNLSGIADMCGLCRVNIVFYRVREVTSTPLFILPMKMCESSQPHIALLPKERDVQ